MKNKSEKAIKGRYKWDDGPGPEQHLAIQAKDLVEAWNNNLRNLPTWLFNHFITGKIYVSEGAVYIGKAVSRYNDWIIEGLDGNLIFCTNENFERIREMLREKAKNEE